MPSFDEEKALTVDGEKETSIPATNEKQNGTGPKSKIMYLIAGVILLAAIVVGITVPVVRNDDDSKKVSKLTEDETEPPEERYDDLSKSPTDRETGAPARSGKPPADTGPPTASPHSDPTSSPTAEKLSGPNITAFSVFNPHLANFDEGILSGYDSDDDLAEGLGDALRALLDRVVARNLGTPGYDNVAMGGPMFAFTDGGIVEDAGAAPPVAPSQATPERGSVDDNVNDFGTNNQEKGVEEGDTVVANQDFSKYSRRCFIRPYLRSHVFLIFFFLGFAVNSLCSLRRPYRCVQHQFRRPSGNIRVASY